MGYINFVFFVLDILKKNAKFSVTSVTSLIINAYFFKSV